MLCMFNNACCNFCDFLMPQARVMVNCGHVHGPLSQDFYNATFQSSWKMGPQLVSLQLRVCRCQYSHICLRPLQMLKVKCWQYYYFTCTNKKFEQPPQCCGDSLAVDVMLVHCCVGINWHSDIVSSFSMACGILYLASYLTVVFLL